MKTVILLFIISFFSGCNTSNPENLYLQNELDVYNSTVEHIYRNYIHFNDDSLKYIILRDTALYEVDIIKSFEFQYKTGVLVDPNDILDLGIKMRFFKDSLYENLDLDSLSADFRRRNKEQKIIRITKTSLKYKISTISKYDFKKYFKTDLDSGWINFFNKFPNSIGPITFSRVGFNEKQNQAVIFINMIGKTLFIGKFLFYIKRDDTWHTSGEYQMYNLSN